MGCMKLQPMPRLNKTMRKLQQQKMCSTMLLIFPLKFTEWFVAEVITFWLRIYTWPSITRAKAFHSIFLLRALDRNDQFRTIFRMSSDRYNCIQIERWAMALFKLYLYEFHLRSFSDEIRETHLKEDERVYDAWPIHWFTIFVSLAYLIEIRWTIVCRVALMRNVSS